MLLKRFSFLSVVMLASHGGAYADRVSVDFPAVTQDLSDAEMRKWYCVDDMKKIARMAIDSHDVQINNFAVQSSRGDLTDAPAIQLSASVVNRSNRPVSVSIEYIGIRGNEPLFFITARPIIATIAGQNDVIHGSVFVSEELLDQAKIGCIRVNGYISAG